MVVGKRVARMHLGEAYIGVRACDVIEAHVENLVV